MPIERMGEKIRQLLNCCHLGFIIVRSAAQLGVAGVSYLPAPPWLHRLHRLHRLHYLHRALRVALQTRLRTGLARPGPRPWSL